MKITVYRYEYSLIIHEIHKKEIYSIVIVETQSQSVYLYLYCGDSQQKSSHDIFQTETVYDSFIYRDPTLPAEDWDQN